VRNRCIASYHPRPVPTFLPSVNAGVIFFFLLPLNGLAFSPGSSSDRHGSENASRPVLACAIFSRALSALASDRPLALLDGGLGRTMGPVLHLARFFQYANTDVGSEPTFRTVLALGKLARLRTSRRPSSLSSDYRLILSRTGPTPLSSI
jgi:hypothetical protein